MVIKDKALMWTIIGVFVSATVGFPAVYYFIRDEIVTNATVPEQSPPQKIIHSEDRGFKF